MGIVGDHQRQPRFPRQTLQTLVQGALLVNAMVLHFQIKMLRAKNTGELQGHALGLVIVFIHKRLGDGTGQTGGQGDKPFMVPLQQLQVHPGLSVEAVQKGLRHQIAQVLVALLIFAQQNQVVGVIVQSVNPVRHFSAGI